MRFRLKFAIIVVFIFSIFVHGVSANSLGYALSLRPLHGDDVHESQPYLIDIGYDLVADGINGEATERVDKILQQSAGLGADGIVGQDTVNQLGTKIVPAITHIVEPAETLSHIAQQHSTSIAQIREQNDVRGDLIRVGQKLLITEEPSTTRFQERIYQVRSGDTLSAIAGKFRVKSDALVAINDLTNPNLLRVGQRIRIPELLAINDGGLDSMIWPVRGRVTSPFGSRIHPIYKTQSFHGGLDIAAPMGTPVQAAAAGIVVRSQSMGAYGLGIMIDHGNGVATLYGHNSELLVRPGDFVETGDVIAKVGSTGVSTGPHVDFRIQIDGSLVDPIKYLP